MRKEAPSPSPLLSVDDPHAGEGEGDGMSFSNSNVGRGFPHALGPPGEERMLMASFEVDEGPVEGDSLLRNSFSGLGQQSQSSRGRIFSRSAPRSRASGSGSENGGRGGIADSWGAVSDLDEFFLRIYNYYREKGFACIVMGRLAELIKIGFTVVFSTFLFGFVRWSKLLDCKNEETCGKFSAYVDADFFAPENRGASFWAVVAYFMLFTLYWAWMAFSFFPSARVAWDMRRFYRDKLLITTDQLQTMTWGSVVERLLELQRSGRYRFQINKSSLSAQHIAMRIMRKENYLVAMINHAVLPFGSDVGLFSASWYLGKCLEVNLQLCLLNHMFTDRFTLRRKFVTNPSLLASRFRWMGLANLLAMPFILMFMLVFFFLKHAEEFHSRKNYLGRRWWSPHMVWAIREFNELPHLFNKRLCLALPHSDSFLKQFPSPLPTVLAGGFSFLLGSVIGVLLIFTFMDESIMLYVTVWDRNLLWYMAMLSLGVAIARSFIPKPEERAFQPNQEMQKVTTFTHYLPLRWRGKTHTYNVRDEFADMYQFKVMLFLREIACVFITPLVLAFVLPDYAEKVVEFVDSITVHEDGVGDVCVFSLMNLKEHGDPAYGSPRDVGRNETSIKTYDGKLEKSWLNFWVNYPEWARTRKVNDGGDKLVAALEVFQQESTQKMLLRASNMLVSSSNMNDTNSMMSDGAASAHATLVCELAGSIMMQNSAVEKSTGAMSTSVISHTESFFDNARSVFLPLRDVRFSQGENYFYWLELYRDKRYFSGKFAGEGESGDADDSGRDIKITVPV